MPGYRDVFREFYYVFSFLAGQLFTFPESKRVFGILQIFSALLALAINLYSFAYNMYIVISAPYYHGSYFDVESLVEDLSSDHTLNPNVSGDTETKYYNLNKIVIALNSIAALLSCLAMVSMVLLPNHSLCRSWFSKVPDVLCLRRLRKCSESTPFVSPFCIGENHKMYRIDIEDEELIYFYGFYYLNLILFVSSVAVFSVTMRHRTCERPLYLHCAWDITGLTFQLFSQFCAMQSCFIFSKVSYISNNWGKKILDAFREVDEMNDERLEEIFQPPVEGPQQPPVEGPQQPPVEGPQQSSLSTYLAKLLNMRRDDVGEEGDVDESLEEFVIHNKDQGRLYLLQSIDRLVLKKIRHSLQPFGTWFTLHWVLYSLTTFVSLALLAETLSLFLDETNHGTNGQNETNNWTNLPRSRIDLSYVLLYTAESLFLFIYPCFRAVQVTLAREKMIRRVTKYRWKKMTMQVRASLLDHMRTQNFGFRISLFCIDITFGFNLAFLSIFIGLFGAILKLAI